VRDWSTVQCWNWLAAVHSPVHPSSIPALDHGLLCTSTTGVTRPPALPSPTTQLYCVPRQEGATQSLWLQGPVSVYRHQAGAEKLQAWRPCLSFLIIKCLLLLCAQWCKIKSRINAILIQMDKFEIKSIIILSKMEWLACMQQHTQIPNQRNQQNKKTLKVILLMYCTNSNDFTFSHLLVNCCDFILIHSKSRQEKWQLTARSQLFLITWLVACSAGQMLFRVKAMIQRL